MKLLLDHNLDRRLKNYLTEYETATTQEEGLADALNGELITLLEENDFNILLTADANIKTQQNIENRNISILVLRAFNNRLKTHALMIFIRLYRNLKQAKLLKFFTRYEEKLK